MVFLIFAVYINRSRASRTVPQVLKLTLSEALSGKVSVPFAPEYERKMDQVFLTVEHCALPEDLEGKESILRSVPEYTHITLLAHRHWMHSDRAELAGNPMRRLREVIAETGMIDRCRVISMDYKRGNRLSTTWMQDAGEGGGNGFFLGAKGGIYGQILAESGVRTVQHLLPLDGGNVSLARNRWGKPIVFVGSSEFTRAREMLGGGDEPLTDQEIEKVYCRAFRAERLVVLPNLRDEHIDQTVLFLRDGLAAIEYLSPMSEEDAFALAEYRAATSGSVKSFERKLLPAFAADYDGATRWLSPLRKGPNRVVPEIPTICLPNEDARVFGEMRDCVPHLQDLIYADDFEGLRKATEDLLKENGFNIVPLETTLHARLNYQFHMNAMVFRHRVTGQSEIIFPVYPEPGREQAAVDVGRPARHSTANIATLTSLGFRVRPVRGQYLRGGSTHCAMYQL